MIIDPEHIKTLCKKIIEESTHWCNPSILDIRRIYKFAKGLSIELSPDYEKFYTDKLIEAIKNRRPSDYSDERNLFYNCINDTLALIEANKDLLSEMKRQDFLLLIDKK